MLMQAAKGSGELLLRSNRLYGLLVMVLLSYNIKSTFLTHYVYNMCKIIISIRWLNIPFFVLMLKCFVFNLQSKLTPK